jgi:cell division protein FtsB
LNTKKEKIAQLVKANTKLEDKVEKLHRGKPLLFNPTAK